MYECFCYNPVPEEKSRQKKRCQNEILIYPLIFPPKAFIVSLAVEKPEASERFWLKSKEALGLYQMESLRLTESLLEMQGKLLLMCTDNKDELGFLWSCLTCVNCVIRSSLRVLIKALWSCCIVLCIQLGATGAQMAFFMFCVLAGRCRVWYGPQWGET